jgi:hypothetical protein
MVIFKSSKSPCLRRGPYFRVYKSSFHDLLMQKCSSLFMLFIGLELNYSYFPDDVFTASRFHGQDTGVLKLDAMTQVYAALSHG